MNNELKEAQNELNNFLETYPEMKEKQKKLESILNSTPASKRLETVILLIQESLLNLSTKCKKGIKELHKRTDN